MQGFVAKREEQAYLYSPTKKLCIVKIDIFFQPWQITYWNELVMKIRALLQRFNQTWNLQKAFFVFSEDALVSSEVTKSVANVASLRINHCWPYSPHGSNGTCAKVVQDDNPHLHEISVKVLQIYGFGRLLQMTKSARHLIQHMFNTFTQVKVALSSA